MKKIISVFIVTILVICSLTACNKESTPSVENVSENSSRKLSIVTTIFPEYDWVTQILGDTAENADVTMLLDNGVDLHSFQPTAEDIMKISTCDLFIYVGGESDEWVEDALKEATNKDMIVINLLDVLGDSVKEEEVVEGMQPEDEEEDEEEEEEPEYDEHVWLSLRNAEILCGSIADSLVKADSQNADTYKNNFENYKTRLSELDKKYEETVSTAKTKTLLFGDRFPFRYFTDDYGLEYYAAFVGCSAETEASFETITFLAKKADELSLNSVMTIEGDNHKIAETIVSNTKSKNQKILTLDSMQATTSKDVENGTTYLSIMTDNLSVLSEALN